MAIDPLVELKKSELHALFYEKHRDEIQARYNVHLQDANAKSLEIYDNNKALKEIFTNQKEIFQISIRKY